MSRYQKGKTNLDFTEARDSEWQWHQLGHMQVSTSLQTDNHASTPPLSFLQAGCPSCRPTNSVKALKATIGVTANFRDAIVFAALKDAFSDLDYGGNGSIRAHDLGTALRAIGQTPTEADIHELLLDAVLDGV